MIIEVAKGIKFVRAQGAGFQYCHTMFVDSDIKAVIDTGAGERALAEIGPERMDLVINSHYHRDHTGGNHLFPQAKVLVHRLEYPPLVDEEARLFYSGLHRLDQMNLPEQTRLVNRQKDKYFPPRIFKVDGFVEEGEVIDFGHTRARVLHLPGHTPGHLGFHFENENILCGADIDLTSPGPWYGDFLSNLDDFERSIRRLMNLKPHIYCCAHLKPVRENIIPKLQQYLDKIQQTEDKVALFLEDAVSLDNLVGHNIMAKNYDYPYNAFWERNMIEKQLERMIKKGRAVETSDGLYHLAAGVN